MADFRTFKRGSSFVGTLVWTPATGEPANLIGCTVTSSILDSNRDRHELTVTNPSGDGINYLIRDDSTTDWSTGDAYWDVKIDNGSSLSYTTTWTFNIVQQITL